MIRSSLWDMLGIRYPILQGGMAWAAALVKKRQTASEIIGEMFLEAEGILNGAGKWVS